MDEYSVDIAWSDEDGGYIALVPELEGLSAFGQTPEEALQELQIAKELYLETCEERGLELPPPCKRTQYSGQFRLRLPRSLHERLAKAAARDGVSLNTYVVAALSEHIGTNAASTAPRPKAGSAR